MVNKKTAQPSPAPNSPAPPTRTEGAGTKGSLRCSYEESKEDNQMRFIDEHGIDVKGNPVSRARQDI